MKILQIHQLAGKTLHDLTTDEGILASARSELFGCTFGRDSFITIIQALEAFEVLPESQKITLLPVIQKFKNALLVLTTEQGKKINLENGEQPGKFLHELRKTNHEHLTKAKKPWFLDTDGVMRIYDSLDSTPLGLMAIYKYWESTKDDSFLIETLPAVEAALNWTLSYGDMDKDGLLEYELPTERRHGGLTIQSWTDSRESFANLEGILPKYPIAPIEIQSYAWLALKIWSDFYANNYNSPVFARKLSSIADSMKQKFNNAFIFQDQGLSFGAQALDGDKQPIKTVTANPLLCLWASFRKGGKTESIVHDRFIPDFIERAFMPDMFVAHAGIRTMSSLSPTFNPGRDSYHNGSFWPMLNGLIVKGLENVNSTDRAKKLRHASLLPIEYFGFPLELYNVDEHNNYTEYRSPSGHIGCRNQAWSAAAILCMIASALRQTEAQIPSLLQPT